MITPTRYELKKIYLVYVTYKYDEYGNLIEIDDGDFSRVLIEYKYNDSTYTGNRVTSYTKQLNNGSDWYEDYTIQFDIQSPFRRIVKKGFISQGNFHVDDTEILQYDNDINLVTHKDFGGKYVCATYDNNGIIESFAFEENKTNLLTNNSFENGPGSQITGWTRNPSTNIKKINSTWVDNSHGTKELQMSSSIPFNGSASQIVNRTFLADKTYVVGCWVKTQNTIPQKDNYVGISVESGTNDSFQELFFVPFDNHPDGVWQFRLVAFKLESDVTSLRINLKVNEQLGDIRFDEITLFEAEESLADLEGVSLSSPITIDYNDDGLLESETLSNGILSMVASYEYEANKQLSSFMDINGNISYYDYDSENGLLNKMGTIKSGNTILDPVKFSYSANGLLEKIEKTITNISSGDPTNLITQYEYDGDQISTVTHNGFSYDFCYDEQGKLLSVDASSLLYSPSLNEAKFIEYEYNSANNIGEIRYKNGLIITYSYNTNNGQPKIDEINYIINNTTVKSFEYTYYIDGRINTVVDTKSGYKIEYNANGYELFRNNGTDYISLYKVVNNSDGSRTEIYMPDLYVENNVPKNTITTSSSTINNDTSTGITTTSSSIDANIVSRWLSSYDNDQCQYSYMRQSVQDYFGRIIQKSVELDTSTINGDTESRIVNDYEYKLIDEGITSGLVSSQTSTIEVSQTVNGPTNITVERTTLYEYDHKGNVVLISREYSDGFSQPLIFYQYDEANQLVGELNIPKKLSATYTYDSGGNLTAKIYHDYLSATYNQLNMTVTNYGTVINTVTYGYDNVWKDRMTSYNNTTVTYDNLGNPLIYAVPTYTVSSNNLDPSTNTYINNSVSGNLEWLGQYLTALETENARYEYNYDANGYRTQKKIYDKDIDELSPSGYSYRLDVEYTYIWDNGVLKSIILESNTSSPLHSDIIYDQDGSLAGFITSLGVPYYYRKDFNENVRGIVNVSGQEIISISYDAWGQMSIVINADSSNGLSGLLTYLAYGFTAALNPATYHGYLYDYESGLYFNKGRCYSPAWSRYLNQDEPEKLLEHTQNSLSSNLYLFCNNNAVNQLDPYGSWSREYTGIQWMPDGFEVKMNKAFLSRPFCAVFANQIIRKFGTWDLYNGYNYLGMNTLRISSDLFAHCVGKNALASINKVNASWGDGWILKNSQSDVIRIRKDDNNDWKYLKIWYAASDIKMYAWREGIYITL